MRSDFDKMMDKLARKLLRLKRIEELERSERAVKFWRAVREGGRIKYATWEGNTGLWEPQ